MKVQRRFSVSSSILNILQSVYVADDGKLGYVLGQECSAENFDEMQSRLSQAIYSNFHAGMRRVAPAEEISFHRGDKEVEELIRNATSVDHFEEEVQKAQYQNHLNSEDVTIAVIDGIKVSIPTNSITRDETEYVTVRRSSLNYRLSLGFTYYRNQYPPTIATPLLRVYRWASRPEELLTSWSALIDLGERGRFPLQMKMLSERESYPRNDALVVYISGSGLQFLEEIVHLLSTENTVATTSLFARKVANGVSLAWEPHDHASYRKQLSFGEHRSEQLARGVIRSIRDSIPVASAIRATLLQGNIDPSNPSRNLTSPSLGLCL